MKNVRSVSQNSPTLELLQSIKINQAKDLGPFQDVKIIAKPDKIRKSNVKLDNNYKYQDSMASIAYSKLLKILNMRQILIK
ncbi:unnamed protein product [Paramecium sonneborni]|uniref:Uncharacterized protein n=1 Tax=Paramecium sonneborni TaxID=65129 RepID=A0A8S1KSF3_9CILI|nr:unnamed protein product [Paramecium sonneborni]